jgi:hypothetical protein
VKKKKHTEKVPKRKINKKSLENLRPPWKPGETGNPNGSYGPKLKSIAQEVGELDAPAKIIRKLEKAGIAVTDKRIAKVLMLAGAYRGLAGDNTAWKEFNDRHDGKAAQPITGARGEPPIDIHTETSIKSDTLKQIEEILYKNQTPDSGT